MKNPRAIKVMAAARQHVKNAAAPVTIGVLFDFIEEMTDAIFMLQDELKEMKARAELKYLGVYEHGSAYRAGSAVTFGGSVWIAKCACAGERPGEGDSWQLAVKAGRDGRDGRR